MAFSMCTIAIFEGHAGQKSKSRKIKIDEIQTQKLN